MNYPSIVRKKNIDQINIPGLLKVLIQQLGGGWSWSSKKKDDVPKDRIAHKSKRGGNNDQSLLKKLFLYQGLKLQTPGIRTLQHFLNWLFDSTLGFCLELRDLLD